MKEISILNMAQNVCTHVCEFIKQYHCDLCDAISKRELKLIMDEHFMCQNIF